jgi:hypothetical protein
MAIRYSKNRDYNGQHVYTALGNPVDREPDPFIAPEPGDLQERPYASVSVKHTPKQFNVSFPNNDDAESETGLGHDYLYDVKRKLEDKKTDNWDDVDRKAAQTLNSIYSSHNHDPNFIKKQMATNPHFQPETLFTETPSSMEITNMVSDPSMSHTAMTMVSLAKRDLRTDKIIASDDLSKHSSKLTKNAIAMGLPVETHENNSNARQTNTIAKGPRAIRVGSQDNPWGFDQDETVISEEDVKGARQDLRTMIRGDRKMRNTTPVTKKGLSDQFLPGMEGFV